jgi:hypothetical protein
MKYTNSVIDVEDLLPRLARISTRNKSIFFFEVDPSLVRISSDAKNELNRLKTLESQVDVAEVELLSREFGLRFVCAFNHRNSSGYGQTYSTKDDKVVPWRYGIPGNIQTLGQTLDWFNQE